MLDRASTLFLTAVDYVRGRVIPMYRRSDVLFASRYLTLLGRIFLRTPMFTEAELKAAKGNEDHLGLGPVPAYMRDEFQYWRSDRTVKDDAEHLNASILLSVYRNKSYKDLSWRAFVVGLLIVGAISIAGSGLWLIQDTVTSGIHRVVYAVHHLTGSSSKPSDDTADLFPPKVRDAIAAAVAAKTPLSEAQQANANDTDGCSAFMASVILDKGKQLAGNINNPSTMVQAQQKLDNCHKAGFTYNADLVATLQPFQDAYGSNDRSKWVALLRSSTLPGSWTPLSDFSICEDTLKRVLNSPSATDFNGVHAAADCLNHGSTLPAPTASQDD